MSILYIYAIYSSKTDHSHLIGGIVYFTLALEFKTIIRRFEGGR